MSSPSFDWNLKTDQKKFIGSAPLESPGEFFENAVVGIHLENTEGRIVYANKAELDLLGYSPEEYIGHPFSEFHEDQSIVEEISRTVERGEKVINKEARLRCKDGSTKDVLISCSVQVQNSTLRFNQCFTRDITSLKTAEKLLRLLNKAGEELSETHDIAEALDKISRFIVPGFADWVVINELGNDGFAHLLKMAHADPAKVKWAEEYRRQHPVDLNDPQVGSVGWVMRTGQSLLISEITDEIIDRGAREEEQRALLKELAINSVMMVSMQVKGRVTGVVSFMLCNRSMGYNDQDFNFAKDFTNRIALTLENARLYEALSRELAERIQADKKKDEFLSMASHELKTPVTSLKAYTQVLQMTFDAKKNTEESNMVAKMNKQVDKLTGLIVTLLDVTKLEQGEMVFDVEEFDFNELVTEIAEELQLTTAIHKIELQLKECDKISGDKNRIGQVITNLISNAIKYSPDSEKILISTSCGDHLVKFCVRDFGIGIALDKQSKIFQRFYRVSGDTENSFPGLGLGLYICSEIIKRHEGKIYFESTGGSGSTFCFEIKGLDKNVSK